MYVTQQHWQQPQQQQPLDGCYMTATAYRLKSNESSDSCDSSSNPISITSSNNTSFSSGEGNCTQQQQQEEDMESLWVVDGLYFTCINPGSRARSAVESTVATNRGNDRHPLPPFPTSKPFESTSTSSVLSLSPPPSPTTPTRPPLIRIESQELLPTRRPDLGYRRSSSSNSICSLASRRSSASRRDQHQHTQKQQQQQEQQLLLLHQQRQIVVPAKPLKSILKKTRPVTPTTSVGRHLAHAHLGPLLQHQHQLQLPTQQQQQQQASPYSQDSLTLHRRSSSIHHLKHLSSIINASLPLPPLRPRPLSSPSILTTFSTTPQPPSFPRPLPLPPRPLPTPPAIKTVHWASHMEVFFIENIEELIDMGYFDDYDSEMGWDYRDESLDDDFSVTMDSEEEDDFGSDFDLMDEADGSDEELVSPSEDGRFEYMFRLSAIEKDASFNNGQGEGEEVLQSPSEDGSFEHMYRRSVDESDVSFDEDDSEDDSEEDVESSAAEEVESSVAEDELILRMASDQLLGGGKGGKWPSLLYPPLSISPGISRSTWPSLLYPPLSITSKEARSMFVSHPAPPVAPPLSPLSPSFWLPPSSQEQYKGVSGIIQRFQYLENQNQKNGFTKSSTTNKSTGMISPPASPSSPQPPPRQSSLTDQSIVINKDDTGRSKSPTSSLPSPSNSASTSPKLAPEVPLIAPSALKGKIGAPRLDRAQILAEVAERKRKGVGAFASSTASASKYRADRPLSMVSSASNLLHCSRGTIPAVTVVQN